MLVPPRRTDSETGSREGTVPLKAQHVEHVDHRGACLCEARLYLLVTLHKEITSGSACDAPQATTTSLSESSFFEHCIDAVQPAGDMIPSLNFYS